MVSSQNQAPAAGAGGDMAIDERVIEAIIRAVDRYNSFVLRYSWITDELRDLVSKNKYYVLKEYYALKEKLHEYIATGRIRNVRMIYDYVVAVAPCEVPEEKWRVLKELAELYGYEAYDDPCSFKYFTVMFSHPSLDFVLHNLIRAWCMLGEYDDNAEALYNSFATVLRKKFDEIVSYDP
jgi:hypothetical protein